MPLRILHVTPYCDAAWAYGGIPRVVGALTHGLARRGHHVTVCATDACDATSRLPGSVDGSRFRARPPVSLQDDVVLRVFPNISNAAAYSLQAFLPIGMRDYLRRHAGDFDVAHIHACRNVPGALAAHYLRRADVPYLVAPNGTAPIIERRRAAKHLFDAIAGRSVLAGAARVLAVSSAEERQLLDMRVPPSQIRTVPNPIDLTEFSTPPHRGSLRDRWGVGSAPVVLFLGKITPRKNVETLVRAFGGLDDRNARLVVAGNDMGGASRAAGVARELGLHDRTIFTGLLKGAERLQALVDADVVVYPSEHEVFGLVPFEALLLGTPVVVAGDSGCGDLIRAAGGGVVVPVGDVNALSIAIDRVLASRAEWRLAAGPAAAHIRARYGDAAVCARLEGIYSECIARQQEAISA